MSYQAHSQNYAAGMEARFKVAARHSRRVRLLRKAVPAIVILALVAVAAVSLFNPFRFLNKLPIDLSGLSVSGTKITMDQPHLAGFMPDRRPYEIWANAATQDVTDPTKVDMQSIRAQVQMEDKSTLKLDSDKGHFDTKSQALDLMENILLQTTSGYEARLSQAHIDMTTGIVTSDNPVAVKLTNGTLDSQNLKITERGASALFGGGVTMHLRLPAAASDAGADAPAQSDANAAPEETAR